MEKDVLEMADSRLRFNYLKEDISEIDYNDVNSVMDFFAKNKRPKIAPSGDEELDLARKKALIDEMIDRFDMDFEDILSYFNESGEIVSLRDYLEGKSLENLYNLDYDLFQEEPEEQKGSQIFFGKFSTFIERSSRRRRSFGEIQKTRRGFYR